MPSKFQSIRGMNDVLPNETASLRNIEAQFITCMLQYGYQEIRFPILESTQLFKRTIGEVTDIVEKEMYSFIDLNGESITLRPEGTAGCLRACLQHNLIARQIQKLWYTGPMFRHEKPQKGRYRQFHHFGVEVFGIPGPYIEIELLMICTRLWKLFNVQEKVQLEINTLGTLEERNRYKIKLIEYFKNNFLKLDEDSKRRLEKNPLRILDSKNPDMQVLISKAPHLLDSFTKESINKFEDICKCLDKLGLSYSINPRLVRGLDYYDHLVFEWTTTNLGAQGTICAGGRYDRLIEYLGASAMPAIGFAIGIERLLLLIEHTKIKTPPKTPSFIILSEDEEGMQQGLILAEELRNINDAWHIYVDMLQGNFKNQFKRASKQEIEYALIFGANELKENTISIKNLKNYTQVNLPKAKLADYLIKELSVTPV